MTLAIIPARGGSKGIPGKNILPIGGRPLIAWTIEQALKSSLVSRVIVTTDCPHIADVAERWGAEVFNRSAATATDTASTESAMAEVLMSLPLVDRDPITVLLQATSPIRQEHDIDNAIHRLVALGYDSVFSARAVEGYTWKDAAVLSPNYVQRTPRQANTSRTLEENGSIYVMHTDLFLHKGNRLCGNVGYYLMNALDSFQIDVPEDVPLVEQLIRVRLPDAYSHAT